MLDTVSVGDILLTSAKEIFETMVFMSIEKAQEPESKLVGDTLIGAITFKNGVKGCFGICCGIDCAREIAANLLGTEPTAEITKEEICDAIGEVTNMIMGRVKTLIRDSIGDVQVSIPVVISGREIDNNLCDGADKILVPATIQDKYIAMLSLLYKIT